MKKLSVLTKEQASDQSKEIFENIEKSVGMLPNIYAVIGNSSNALSAYLTLSEAQKSSSFTAREREAVSLAVSEENNCNYCKSAHTALASMNGFTKDETLALRAGTITDKKLNVLVNLTKSLINNRGKADEKLVQNFFEAGYDEKALVDLVLLVSAITFTTYIGRLAQPEIDFPVATPLKINSAA